jgi:hypothetical protein
MVQINDLCLTDADVFDEWLDRFRQQGYDVGWRFDPAPYSAGMVKLCEGRKKKARKVIETAIATVPNLPFVYFEFTNSTRLQACAFGNQWQYFIAYSAGTEYLLHLTFHRMLADSGCLLALGAAEHERSDLPPLIGLVGTRPDLQTIPFNLQAIPEVRDPVRRNFAALLRDLVADYIVNHELYHVIRGHVTYGDARLRGSMATNWGQPQTAPEMCLVNQALEMDADAQAAASGVHNVLYRVRNSATLPPAVREFYQDPEVALGDWVFAVSVYCRLYGDDYRVGVDLKEGGYPPWRVRQKMILTTALNCAKSEQYDGAFGTEAEVLDLIVSASMCADKAMSRITGTELQVQGLLDTDHTDVTRHRTTMRDIWRGGLLDELNRHHAYLPYQ